MIAGGFAADYVFKPPFIPNAQEIYVPGTALAKAWLYDGNFWVPVNDMSTVRDRPACSVVQLPGGTTTNTIANIQYVSNEY